MSPILIVSTGHCGSTMMSEIMRLHPAVLSVSEFFVTFSSRAFVGGPLDGEEMCQRLTTPAPIISELHKLGLPLESDKFLYRFGSDSRYQPEDLPPLLNITLPFLSNDPDGLQDGLVAAVRDRGEATLAEQYRFVLDWLTGHLGRRTWVERSGLSIRHVPVLADWFPDARFIHLYRDGRDTALSSKTDIAVRFTLQYMLGLASVGLDPFVLKNTVGVDRLFPYIEQKLAGRRLVEEDLEREGPDVVEYGWMWNGMIEKGLDYLGRLSPDRVTAVRYEDVVHAPKEVLGGLFRWLGGDFDDPEWLEAAAKLPRPTPPRWTRLSEEEQERLTEACAPGLKRLGYIRDDAC